MTYLQSQGPVPWPSTSTWRSPWFKGHCDACRIVQSKWTHMSNEDHCRVIWIWAVWIPSSRESLSASSGLLWVSVITKDSSGRMYTGNIIGNYWKFDYESELRRLLPLLQHTSKWLLLYLLLLPPKWDQELWITSYSVLVVLKCFCESQNTSQLTYY